MDKQDSEFPVGYGTRPRHTRFKPGQSGNPGGRRRRKSAPLLGVERELNTRIIVNEGGKPRRLTKLDAIVKQQTNKALQGDPKATALVMKAVEPRQFDPGDTLSPVVQAMRAIHAKHELANQKNSRTADASELIGNSANYRVDDDHA